MSRADLTISECNGVSCIRVSGRANFECGMPLRSFAKNFGDNVKRIVIDLGACESMDSTFMGILTMLALRAKKQNTVLELANASDFCRQLLRGLGVEKMFVFTVADLSSEAGRSALLGTEKQDKVGAAEAVVDAHQTLMDVSLDNIAKFEKVVEFAESDLKKFKDEAGEGKK